MAMKIQIVGVGCGTCRRLEADVCEIIQHQGIQAQVERVDDLEKILQYRLYALPGLIIDGRVAACGYSGKNKVERLILAAKAGEPSWEIE
jgi:small redox-active disulfide protein 2